MLILETVRILDCAYFRDCVYIGDCACIFSTKDKITCAFIRVGATNRANTVGKL